MRHSALQPRKSLSLGLRPKPASTELNPPS
jgi:hypothetical protein